MEEIGDIIGRVGKEHFLEDSPSGEELETHLPDIIPPTLKAYVNGYNISGNVLTVFVTDSVSRQELSLRAPEICDNLNARLGRNAVGRIRARTRR